VLATFELDDVSCSVADVSCAPADITSAPTLEIRRPLRLKIADGPVDTRFLTGLFDVAEVPRRRW
jgi:hypothetical protein